MKGVIDMFKKKEYVITCYKYGKEWKSFVEGMDFLDDEKLYKFKWTVTGTLWQVLKAKRDLKHNKRGQFKVH